METRAILVLGAVVVGLFVGVWLVGARTGSDLSGRHEAVPLGGDDALAGRRGGPGAVDATEEARVPRLSTSEVPPRLHPAEDRPAAGSTGSGLDVASVLLVTAEDFEDAEDDDSYHVYALPASAAGSYTWDEVTNVERGKDVAPVAIELVVNAEGPWDVFLITDQGRRWEALDVRAREARQDVRLAPTPAGDVTFEVGPGEREHPLRISLDALLSDDVEHPVAPGRREAYQLKVRSVVPPGVSRGVLHVPAWMSYEAYAHLRAHRDVARRRPEAVVRWDASPQQVQAGETVHVSAVSLAPLAVHLRVRQPLPAHWPRETSHLLTSVHATSRGPTAYLFGPRLVLTAGSAEPLTISGAVPPGPNTLHVHVAGMLPVPPRDVVVPPDGTDVDIELVPDERARWTPSRPPPLFVQGDPGPAARSFTVRAPFAAARTPDREHGEELPVLFGSDQGRRFFQQRARARSTDDDGPAAAWIWSLTDFEADACTRVGAYFPDGRVTPPVPRASGESVELAFVLGGWVIVAPVRPPDARLGTLGVRRADGFPLVVGGVQTEAKRQVALAPRVEPGTILGPLEPGSHRFHVRVGSQRLPDEIVDVRPGEISVLRIGD
ncbi:MAG: hypothetical protein H6806_10075 [Planctomycetes bacterium]|nr:hypothetical protein [Planctomycetota bacterium]